MLLHGEPRRRVARLEGLVRKVALLRESTILLTTDWPLFPDTRNIAPTIFDLGKTLISHAQAGCGARMPTPLIGFTE